jgi:hypothetical protein
VHLSFLFLLVFQSPDLISSHAVRILICCCFLRPRCARQFRSPARESSGAHSVPREGVGLLSPNLALASVHASAAVFPLRFPLRAERPDQILTFPVPIFRGTGARRECQSDFPLGGTLPVLPPFSFLCASSFFSCSPSSFRSQSRRVGFFRCHVEAERQP